MPSSKQLTAAIVAAVVLSPAVIHAQEKAPEIPLSHYKLTYRLLEVGADGKITNSRSYFAIIGAGGDSAPAKIRTGDKLPIPDGTGAQYHYQDIDTNIDAFHPSVHDRQLSLQVSAQSSSVAKAAANAPPNAPVIRHTSWESSVVVPLDKPTIIFTSDNASDTGKTELELTATEVK